MLGWQKAHESVDHPPCATEGKVCNRNMMACSASDGTRTVPRAELIVA